MSGFETPREKRIITDDFSDLTEDGWTVVQPDTERTVLLVPPGLVDPTDLPEPKAFGKIPRIDVRQVEDGPITVEGSVQSKDKYGDRHPAFDRAQGRSVADLSRRAFYALGAERVKGNWISDGGGLNGSDNYRRYKDEQARLLAAIEQDVAEGELEKFSDPWFARHHEVNREAAKATWTYKTAAYAGFTAISRLTESHLMGDKGTQERVEVYIEKPQDN